MRDNDERSWKIRFAIIMFVLAVVIFLARYLIFGDGEEIIAYLWKHIGFIPIDILIVAFLLEGIMGKKEHEAILEKIDMLMGTFFSELGNDLIRELSKVNANKINTENLKDIKNWNDKDYDNKMKELKANGIDFKADIPKEEREEFLSNIHSILVDKREFFRLLTVSTRPKTVFQLARVKLSCANISLPTSILKEVEKNRLKSGIYMIMELQRIRQNGMESPKRTATVSCRIMIFTRPRIT